jgi:DNA-directed RNA polymerase subunit M/transcription elongation factor TFIIS
MSVFHTWLFLQDGNSEGISLSSLGTNLLNNSIEKIIGYKSFLKLIPNPAQDINSKSKLKMVGEWEISGEYYQLYGWTSGQSSKINSHNFDLDDYPDQDFYGDLILFKVDLNGHKCMPINEIDIQTIDIAKREDDVDEEEEDNQNEEDEEEYGSDDEKVKDKEEDDEEEDEDDDEEENFEYEDDNKGDADDGLDGDEDDEYYDDDEDSGEVSKKKTASSKTVTCNFSRLVCEGILNEQSSETSYTLNEKQQKIFSIFQKLLFPKKTANNLNKTETHILMQLERGIFNWSVREGKKSGFMCLWDDRQFNKIYTRKGIAIYQNLVSSSKLVSTIMDCSLYQLNPDSIEKNINAYNISFMSPSQLCPDKYTDIINKLKEKEKVIFEKRATAGSKHIKCSKCGESDVAVTAAQTRSGDEGITLFMTCNNCGKQWKRS